MSENVSPVKLSSRRVWVLILRKSKRESSARSLRASGTTFVASTKLRRKKKLINDQISCEISNSETIRDLVRDRHSQREHQRTSALPLGASIAGRLLNIRDIKIAKDRIFSTHPSYYVQEMNRPWTDSHWLFKSLLKTVRREILGLHELRESVLHRIYRGTNTWRALFSKVRALNTKYSAHWIDGKNLTDLIISRYANYCEIEIFRIFRSIKYDFGITRIDLDSCPLDLKANPTDFQWGTWARPRALLSKRRSRRLLSLRALHV